MSTISTRTRPTPNHPTSILGWMPLFVVASALLLSQCFAERQPYHYAHQSSALLEKDGYREEGALVFTEPPAPRTEDPADFAKPDDDNAIWVGGRWIWQVGENRFVWQPGSWQLHEHAVGWAPGYWKVKGRGWIWIQGFWESDPPPPSIGTAALRPTLAPPPPRHEVFTSRPSPDAIWIGGHWAWVSGDYVWVPGYWDPHPLSSHWTPGYWSAHPNYGWHWTPGYWNTPRGRVVIYGHPRGTRSGNKPRLRVKTTIEDRLPKKQ